MREIKFRGSEKESNKWVFGYARHWKCCYGDEWHIQGENDNVHIVIPETVGQFTGLKDHKGREIYEGDIVKFCDDRAHELVGVIKWYARACRWGVDCSVSVRGCDYHPFDVRYAFEIIGNIYDNPEMRRLTKTGGFEK